MRLSADRNGSISGIERVAAALLLAGAAAGAIVAPGFLAGREPAVPPASAVGAHATTVVQAAPLPRQQPTPALPSVHPAAAPLRRATPVQHAHVATPPASAARPHAAPATPPAVAPAAPPPSDSTTVASAQTLTPLASVATASASTNTGNGHGKSQGRGPKQSPPPQAQPSAPEAAAASPGNGNNGNGNGKGNGQGHGKGSA